jgi:hypothetical protein
LALEVLADLRALRDETEEADLLLDASILHQPDLGYSRIARMRHLSTPISFLLVAASLVAWVLVALHGSPLHVAMALLATGTAGLFAYARVDRGAPLPLDHAQMESALSREIFRARRYQRPFSVLLLDPAEVPARDVGRAVRELIRKTDEVGFWQERKLMLVLAEGNEHDASSLGERIKKAIAPNAHFGFTEYRQDDSIQTIVERLDASLSSYSRYFLGKETLDASTSS